MIQKADQREKKIAVVISIVLICVFSAMLYFFMQWQSQVDDLVKAGGFEEARKQMGIMRLCVFGMMILSSLGIAFVLARNALRSIQEKRYPASNTPVFRDTEVLIGDAAIKKARVLLVAAASAVLAALVALYFATAS